MSFFNYGRILIGRNLMLEQLEERIVLDAAVEASTQENGDQSQPETPQEAGGTQVPMAEASGEPVARSDQASEPLGHIFGEDLSDVLITSAPDQFGSDPNTKDEASDTRVLVVSSAIAGSEDLIEAAQDNVLTVLYDFANDTPDTLLDQIRNALDGGQAGSIAFAAHNSGEAAFHLTDGYRVSPSALLDGADLQTFWTELGSLLSDEGRIDLMACDLASTDAGNLLVSQLERITGRDVAASDDPTGNLEYGGDWLLETDDVDLATTYFVPDMLQDFHGVLSDLLAEVVGSRDTGDDRFGKSVAIWGDYAVVAAPFSDYGGSKAGCAFIYARDQGGADQWGEVAIVQGDDIYGGNNFGSSVAIWEDYIVVGAANKDAAYLFWKDQGGTDNWGQVKKLKGGDWAGDSVAIYEDTIIVGAPEADVSGVDRAGAVYIFQRDEGGADNWGRVTRIDAPSLPQSVSKFGGSVAISGDDLIVGAYLEYDSVLDYDSGAAYIFSRDQGGPDSWGQVKRLVADDAGQVDLDDDSFGWSVGISGDYAVVGAKWAEDAPTNSDGGAAYIFARDEGGNDNWGQVTKLISSDIEDGDNFGSSVSITGHKAIVGAYGEGGPSLGAAYVFARDIGGSDNWGEVEKLTRVAPEPLDDFGVSVYFSDSTAIVGGDQEWYGPGFADLFQVNLAPVLLDGDPYMDDISEDIPLNSNGGTLVADIIARSGGINDADVADPKGIAVVGVDETHGTWWYTYDNGLNWTSMTGDYEKQATVLAADSRTRLQFRPDQDFNGTVTGGLTFKAWDQSDGLRNGLQGVDSRYTADGAFSLATDTVRITVDPINDAPVLVDGGIPNQVFDDDAGLTYVDLRPYFDDVEDGAYLDYWWEDGDRDVVHLVYRFGTPDHYILVEPYPNSSGTGDVTIHAVDYGDGSDTTRLQVEQTITISVVNENQAPVEKNGGLPDIEVDEGALDTIVDLRNYFDDLEDGSNLIYEVVGTPDPNLFDSVSLDGALLTLNYKENANGDETITIRGTDHGDDGAPSKSLDQEFQVTVNPINDQPTVDPVYGGLQNVTVNEDAANTEIDVWRYFQDTEDGDNLTYSIVGSWDASLFASAGIGPDGHTLVMDYGENEHGSDKITIRGVDRGDGAAPAKHLDQTFTVTVLPANDNPVYDPSNGPIADVEVDEDSANSSIDLWAHFDDVEDGHYLTYTIESGWDASLFQSVVIEPDGHTLTIDYEENANGSDQITIRGTDNGDGSDTRKLFLDQEFTVDVNAVNDAPVMVPPASVILLEDTSVAITGVSISDLDLDEGNGRIEVALSVAHGTIELADTSGLTFIPPGWNGSGNVIFSGLLTDVNNAVSSLNYKPSKDYSGEDSLNIAVNDLGNFGEGGPLVDEGTVEITVIGVPEFDEFGKSYDYHSGHTVGSDSETSPLSTVESIPAIGNLLQGLSTMGLLPPDLTESQGASAGGSSEALSQFEILMHEALFGGTQELRNQSWNILLSFVSGKKAEAGEEWLGLEDFLFELKQWQVGKPLDEIFLVFQADEIKLVEWLHSLLSSEDLLLGNQQAALDIEDHVQQSLSTKARVFDMNEMQVQDLFLADFGGRGFTDSNEPCVEASKPVSRIFDLGYTSFWDALAS